VASSLPNLLNYSLRPSLRRFYGSSWFIALTAFYFRRIVPLIRRFVPLYGVTVVLALSYRCQCSCPHCGAGEYPKKASGELTPDEILAFTDSLARLGGACIHFFGGEPLMAPRLAEYVAHTKRRGMTATVDTNGLLLSEALVLKLKDAGIDLIRVSLDSPREEEHDAHRGIKGCWRKAVEGIRLCVKHGVPCFMSLYATKENLASGDFEEMIALARSLGVGVRFLSAIQSGRWREKGEVHLSEPEIARLRGLLAPDVCWETEFLQHKDTPFWCNSMLGNKFDVSAYGDVLACAYLPAGFGNIRKEPLETIARRMWGSDMFREGSEHFDCPMNDPAFIDRHDHLIDGDKVRDGGVRPPPVP